MDSRSRIIGFGAYVPERSLTNADLEALVETSDEWIVQRTGIHERRIAATAEFASDMAVRAALDLSDRTGVALDDVDHIIVSSFTPDHFTPTVSALVQGHFGMKAAGTFDLAAGCTGFVYALNVADALVTAQRSRKVLVIAAETVSKAVDYTDRTTCILFGDAAAACLVVRDEQASEGVRGAFLASHFHTDGDMAQCLTCGNHSSSVNGHPAPQGVVVQDGQQVYKYVTRTVPQGLACLLDEAGITVDGLDWFVPHSANMRMISVLCEKAGIPLERTLTSLRLFGNTSSASIPLALWLAQQEGRLKEGDTLALYGFGGGLTQGGLIVRL
ncbi:MAG: beta-ketoacyl-ACP synthase 3 [Coriobacteriaceae bacterium]|nr:beta-ketoacyl-ACP synthase 3 [Coriobacteriaceae bacterium]